MYFCLILKKYLILGFGYGILVAKRTKAERTRKILNNKDLITKEYSDVTTIYI